MTTDANVQTAPKTKKKAGRPPKAPATPITETPEFKTAVAAAASAAVANILGELQKAKQQEGKPAEPGDVTFVEGLAMAIASLTHQGAGRGAPVAPAVIEARKSARERMTTAIIDARAAGAVPRYALRNKIYFDETLVDPIYIDPVTKRQKATEIEWPGVPNEAMIPVNDAAKAIFTEFAASIGSTAINDSKFVKPVVYGVTANGLVVHGAGHALRPLQQPGQGGPAAAPQGEGLRIHGRNQALDPGDTINVLGTVAAPARVGVGQPGRGG